MQSISQFLQRSQTVIDSTMNPYTTYHGFSSSSSSSSFRNAVYNQTEQERPTPPSSLHSVRKPPAKPSKKLPPTPLKVYKVDSINFRKVVQKLTGAPQSQSQSRRLQSVAPPPLDLVTQLFSDSNNSASLQLMSPSTRSTSSLVPADSEALEIKSEKLSDGSVTTASMGSCLSPLSSSWFSLPLLSPGTMASLEQGRVL